MTYVEFLSRVRTEFLKDWSHSPIGSVSGDDWEQIVFEKCLEMNGALGNHFLIERTSATSFPDLVFDKVFGVEVKAANKDEWQTIGNSINESSRVKDVEEIYFFFGKFGGSPDIAIRPYEECLKTIKTTHYPRYFVDMELGEGQSIFGKLGLPYEQFRNLASVERISRLRSFLKSDLTPGEELWWLEGDSSPVIRHLKNLSNSEKERYLTLAFARCPELFGSNRKVKYERATALLLTDFNAVSSNLRDHFSASGEVTLSLSDGRTASVPRMHAKLHHFAKKVRQRLLEMDQVDFDELTHPDENFGSRTDSYASLLDRLCPFTGRGFPLSEIFVDGLANV